jgi:ribokinase
MDLVATCDRPPRVGETLTGRSFYTSFGGKGANQAYAAARLGGDVAMFGRVGCDAYGALLRDNLSSAGCDVSSVQAVACHTGVASIIVDQCTGANSIVVVPGANGEYTCAAWRCDAERLAGVRVVMLQLEIPPDTVAAAARAAKAIGALTILDPAPAQALSDILLRDTDILTPNESELAALSGCQLATFDKNALLRAREILHERFHGTLIVKLGRRGCLISRGGHTCFLDAIPVEPLDTTAAGDVFNAALAVALVEGQDTETACRFALHAAALSITRRGAQSSAPSRAELSALIKTTASAPCEGAGTRICP